MTDRREHSPADTPYRGTTIAVGTRHGKQHQFALAFRSLLGAQLLTPPDLDTDRFGTFTGEVARRGAATGAARGKARLAMEITGLPYGLASEASYGVLPGGWFGHEEIVMFCDEVLGIEVVEGYRSTSVPSTGHRVARPADLPDQLLAGLPQQALTVRPCGPVAGVAKGVSDTDTLATAIAAAVAASPDGLALVEPDLRAHHNPGRRRVLRRLAASLARRLATGCPVCGCPGFGRVSSETGLPCRLCDTPTALVCNEIHACASCSHQLRRPTSAAADPAMCPTCNP
jgi:hypothetical protein